MKSFLKFEPAVFGILNVTNKHGDDLGTIEFNKRWKCHVWMPEGNTQFSKGCLNEIIHKLDQLDFQKNLKNLKQKKKELERYLKQKIHGSRKKK